VWDDGVSICGQDVGMTRRGVLGLLMGAFGTLALGGCGRSQRSLRYRITVEIDTPSGLKTGSSVLENEVDSRNGLAFGEAPMVDLGNGRFVFALIREMYSMAFTILKHYKDLQPPLDKSDGLLYSAAYAAMPFATIKREDYPMLVTFDDINDPKTVREISSSSVRRITFQVVDPDTPLTTGIEERLRWLSAHDNVDLNGDAIGGGSKDPNALAPLLNSTSFRWIKK
jgi:hypothetical protein